MRRYLLTIFLIVGSVLMANSIMASNIVKYEHDLILATIPVGKGPGDLSVNPKTNMIYVTNYGDNTVSVINGKTNSVIATVSVGKAPVHVAVNPNTNSVYVANAKGNTVSVINGNNNSIITTLPVGFLRSYPTLIARPVGVAVDTNTNMVYVTTANGNIVHVIDGLSNSRISTIIINNDILGEWGIGINQKTNKIYVSNAHDGTLSVLKGIKRSKKHPKALLYNSVIITLPVGNRPYNLAVNTSTNMIYVANFKSDTVTVINGANNSVVKTVQVGEGPISVSANPKTNMIYVANFTSESISVISGESNSVIAVIPFVDEPSGVCVNPDTNMVYVSNQENDTVTVIKGLK